MGCQTEIAQKILNGKGDYVLHVKLNQPTLHQGIMDYFDDQLEDDFARVKVRRYQTAGKGHGREEVRSTSCVLCRTICPMAHAGRA